MNRLVYCTIMISSLPADNTPDNYLREGEALPEQLAVGNQVRAALTTTFFVLIGIFFPSVTGECCQLIPSHSLFTLSLSHRHHGWLQ